LNKNLLYIILFLFSFTKLQAQGTAGKDFWVAFMAQDWGCYYNSSWNNYDTAELFISSQFNASVTITAVGQSFSKTVTLKPNITTMVRLPSSVVCRYSDTVTINGVNVNADSIINVYATNRYWYSKGATVVIPSSSIVQAPEYLITTNEDTYNWGWSCNGKVIQSPEFAIVGIADSSVIEIVPTGASSRASGANVPFQITLKKGETFQYITSDRDLTGSIIRTKYLGSKFSVFAGNRQTYINRKNPDGTTCNSSWDHTYEQMLPTVTWGNSYTALPFKNNLKGYTLKIVAAENNTILTINGVYKATLGQGRFYVHEVYNDSLVTINGSNRISVAQFALGGYNCNNHPKSQNGYNYLGDPSQVQLFPDEQMGKSATINTVSQRPTWWSWFSNWGDQEHYINVMTKTADTANFKLNNIKIGFNNWKTSPNLFGYNYTQIKIDSGSHYLQSNKGFLAYVYGYGSWEGYAYAAAANFSPIQNNFIIINAQCVRDTVNFKAVVNDSFDSHYWKIQSKSNTVTGTDISYKFHDTGWYEVKMYCKQIRTNFWDSVTKVLYVADTKIKSLLSSNDTLICDKIDFVEVSKNFNLDNEYKWNDRWPVYYRAIKAPFIYWLEVKERNGCTFRDTMTVRGGAFPKPSFTVSDTQFCFNSNKMVEFKNYSTSKDSIAFYRWQYESHDDTIYSKDSIIKHKFKSASDFPIILRAYTKKGCYYDTFVSINVKNSPKAKFSFTKKDTCFSTNGIFVKNETVINVNYHQRFRWRFSEGNNISNSNPNTLRTYLDTGVFNIKLIYDNNNGCSDTMTQFVHVKPMLKVDFEYPNGVYCSLDSIKLKSLTQTPYSPIKNTWKFSDNTMLNQLSPIKIFTGRGTFNIKLISKSNVGCVDSISKSIFINGTPQVNFTVNKDTQCFNLHSFDFINTTAFNTKLNYEWQLGDNSQSNDSNIYNKKYSLDSTYKITLKATTSVGCFNQISKIITIGKYPKSMFSFNAQKQCLRNNSFNYVNNSTIKKGSIKNYFWSLGDGSSSILKDVNNKKYLNDDTFNIRLISESDLGCFDTSFQKVVVFPKPKANFAINQNTQCYNGHVFNLKNNSTIKNEVLTYNWTLGDNSTSANKDVIKKYAQIGNFNVQLITKSENNCFDTTSIQTVTINPSPVAAFNILNDKQCFKNNKFDFIDNSTIASGNFSNHFWSMGNQQFRLSKDVQNFVYYSEDTFKVQLIVNSNFNCKDTINKKIITFAQPNLKFNIPKDTQCWQNNTFVMQNQTSLKYGQLFSKWDFGDNSTSSNYQPNEKKYPNSSGSYIVKYFANTEHNCIDSSIRRVSLLERPIADFSISDSILCFKNNSFSFFNNTTFSKMNSLSYNWDYGNGATSFGIMPQTINYSNAGFYKAELVVLSSLTNCFDTSHSNLIVSPEPKSSFTINKDSQCLRYNEFVFSNTSTIQFGNMNHFWVLDDGSKTNSLNLTKKFNNENNKNIKLISESNYACMDSLILPMGFYSTPIADFGINSVSQCLNNNSFDFSNQTFLAKGSYTQNWLASDASQSSNLNWVNKNFNLSDTQWIRFAIASNNFCTDTITKKVYIEKDKNITILSILDSVQCLRGNLFELDYKKANPKITIKSSNWNFGLTMNYNNINLIKHSFSAFGVYQILLSTVSDNNCFDTAIKQLNVKPHPVSEFSVLPVCFPNFSEFTNHSKITNGNIASQNWTFGDKTFSNQINPLKMYSSANDFDVTLENISDFGCRDTIFKPKYAIVYPKPKADFDYEKLPTINQDESRMQLNDKSSVFVNEFTWSINNNFESKNQNPLVLLRDTGKFIFGLVVKSDKGCLDTIQKIIGPVYPDFFFYLPNAFSPNNDLFNPEFKGIGTKFIYKFKMEIYNRWGEKVFESNDISKGWDGNYLGKPCMEGNYLVKVSIVPFNEPFKSFQQMLQLLK